MTLPASVKVCVGLSLGSKKELDEGDPGGENDEAVDAIDVRNALAASPPSLPDSRTAFLPLVV